MTAHDDHCSCEHCGAVCRGLFTACKTVWAAGPQPVIVRAQRDGALVPRGRPTAEGDDGRLQLEELTLEPGGLDPTMPQVRVVTGVSSSTSRPSSLPGSRVQGGPVEAISGPELEDVVRQLRTDLAEAAASIHSRLEELDERVKELQVEAAIGNRLEIQVSGLQTALTRLREQCSYLERVLGGLRGDVASVLLLQRQASRG